jgi:acetylornithine aminotransferase
VLGEIERADLVANAAARGRQLRAFIQSIDSALIGELRGSGLLIGVGLTEPVAEAVASACLDNGLIVNAPNDSSIRIAPPLIVGDAEITEFQRRFQAALAALASA